MKINASLLSLAGTICVMSVCPAFAGQPSFNDLKSDQQDSVTLGKQVSVPQPNPGSPWNEITVFQIVNATPEESAAVFTQYNRHKEYFKNMIESKSEGGPDKETVIDYTIQIHVLFFNMNESYAVDDIVSVESSVPGAYQVSWKMVKPGDNTANAVGSVRFEPFGDGTTLMIYDNAVTPKATSLTASVLDTDMARNYATQTILDLSDQLRQAIEKEKVSNNDDLQVKAKQFQDKYAH